MSKQYDEKLKELLAHTEAIAATGAKQNELWNAVFGIGARYGQLFPRKADREAVDASPIMKKIRKIIEKTPAADAPAVEKSGQLMLRLPKSLHTALAEEATIEGVSLNQLILTKLAVQLHQAVSH
jgi:hypothetical protein